MGYYLSCMIAFNIIYFLRCLLSGSNGELTDFNFNKWESIVDFIVMLLAVLLAIVGIVCTIVILQRDDREGEREKGIKYTIEEVEDITAESYLGKFSLLVLSAISLPVNKNILSLILYIIFIVAIGIVYVKKCVVYMNPIITAFDYGVYKCKCTYSFDIEDSNGHCDQKSIEIIFLVRGKKESDFTKNNIIHREYVYTKNFRSKCYFINTKK